MRRTVTCWLYKLNGASIQRVTWSGSQSAAYCPPNVDAPLGSNLNVCVSVFWNLGSYLNHSMSTFVLQRSSGAACARCRRRRCSRRCASPRRRPAPPPPPPRPPPPPPPPTTRARRSRGARPPPPAARPSPATSRPPRPGATRCDSETSNECGLNRYVYRDASRGAYLT